MPTDALDDAAGTHSTPLLSSARCSRDDGRAAMLGRCFHAQEGAIRHHHHFRMRFGRRLAADASRRRRADGFRGWPGRCT